MKRTELDNILNPLEELALLENDIWNGLSLEQIRILFGRGLRYGQLYLLLKEKIELTDPVLSQPHSHLFDKMIWGKIVNKHDDVFYVGIVIGEKRNAQRARDSIPAGECCLEENSKKGALSSVL